jgi:hypothetical protein
MGYRMGRRQPVDRSDLARLLGGDREACLLARTALESGAVFELWSQAVPVQRLISIYERRERSVLRSGQPSIGFSGALDDLRTYEGGELAIGFVDDRAQGGYYFQIFLDPSFSRIIACLGIQPSQVDHPGRTDDLSFE